MDGIGNSSGISKLCFKFLEGGVDIGHATASAAGRSKLGLVGIPDMGATDDNACSWKSTEPAPKNAYT